MHQPQYRDALTRRVRAAVDLPARHQGLHRHGCAPGGATRRARRGEFHAGADRAARGAGAAASRRTCGAARRCPMPVLRLLGPDPVPTAPVERLDAAAGLPARAAQASDRALRPVPRARHHRGDARHARAHCAMPRTRSSTIWRSGITWRGWARPCAASIRASPRSRRKAAASPPQQRRDLLALIGELVADVVPRYPRARRPAVRCELSVTPYGHPIIPLLLDFQSAREAVPGMALPRHAGYPGGAERAAWHVAEACACSRARSAARRPAAGRPKAPSARHAGAAGRKRASNGLPPAPAVLGASLRVAGAANHDDPRAYNRPYSLPGGKLQLLLPRRHAVGPHRLHLCHLAWRRCRAEFRARAQRSWRATTTARAGHAVLIALDGENAWEHYPFNGYYFLRALYAVLAEHPQLRAHHAVRLRAARGIEPGPLPTVCAGSWVHGTLATWMGDAAKNRGWDLLCEAKLAFDRVMREGTLDRAQQRGSRARQLALCESSDWFWWFGDYNPADAVSQFDRLYRRQLVNLYRLLGLAPRRRSSRSRSRSAAARRRPAASCGERRPVEPPLLMRAFLMRTWAALREQRERCTAARLRSPARWRAAAPELARSMRLGAAAARSSTGWPTRASPCGSSCR